MDRITVLMATIPYREKVLGSVISSLHSQVDELRIVFNNYTKIPAWVGNWERVQPVLNTPDILTSNAIWTMMDGIEGYVFTCDDDILYPSDYVGRMIKTLNNRDNRAIATMYGEIVIDNPSDYVHARRGLLYDVALEKDTVVDIGGVGCSAFHTKHFKLHLKDFPEKFIRDLRFALVAAQQKIPIIRIKSEAGWLTTCSSGGPEIRLIWPKDVHNVAQREHIFMNLLMPLIRKRNAKSID